MRRLRAGAGALAVAALSLVACGDDDAAPPASSVTTVTTVTTSVTAGTVSAVTATDDEILAGVTAGSAAGSARLPAAQWTGAVRSACGELPELPDSEIGALFDLFRVQLESDGATQAESLEGIKAFVGGIAVACPDLGARVAGLVPAA